MSHVILKHIYIYKSVYLYNHREWLSPCHREWIGLNVHTIVNFILVKGLVKGQGPLHHRLANNLLFLVFGVSAEWIQMDSLSI